MTMRIDEDCQGELQGAIASTIGLTSIVGPPMMTRIFEHYANASGVYFPGAPFVAAAWLMVAAILLFLVTVRRFGGVPPRDRIDHDPGMGVATAKAVPHVVMSESPLAP